MAKYQKHLGKKDRSDREIHTSPNYASDLNVRGTLMKQT